MNDKILPREKALLLGIDKLDTYEIIAILLRTGYQDKNVLELSLDLIKKYESLIKLSNCSFKELISNKGISTAKALTILALFELFKRIQQEQILDKKSILNHKDAFSIINLAIGYEKVEKFLVLFLNNKNELIKMQIMFEGTVDKSAIYIREIIRLCLENDSNKIILAHNHPSNDLTISHQDIYVTDKIIKACDLMGIKVLDHIIVSCNTYVSVLVNNSLKKPQ